ncbi:MAG: CDP-alcohol phosphatidyltransferase family protein [Gemmatimonadota bacterium]|nr:CDP-alcohol phosphatidyltransferase family protein [Gemmatimonadota bacterium]
MEGGLRLVTLPNALSMTRVLILPAVLWLLARPDPASDRWAIVLLFVAGATDLLDGWLARRRHAVSPSGKVVDPLADKILIGGLLIYLVLERGFPVWLLALVFARDVALILGSSLFYRRERVVFSADWTGKGTTFFLSLLALAHVMEAEEWYPALTLAATTFLIASYVSYARRALRWHEDVEADDG